MGFWKNQPGPTLFHFFKDMVSTGRPSVLRKGPPEFVKKPSSLANIEFTLMTAEKENEYRKFLKNNFKLAKESYIDLPTWDDKWIGVEAHLQNFLVGTIINRPIALPDLPNSGIMDYFCIHPLYRKSGIGSRLLYEIDLATSLTGRLSHIFMKEGSPLWWLPPLKTGYWVWREKGISCIFNSEKVKVINSNYRSTSANDQIGQLVILDTSVTQEEINRICDASPFRIVLALKDECPTWNIDSSYTCYAFNWTPGSFAGWTGFSGCLC